MAPVQKLGNVDTKKRTSQKVAFGIFTLLSYLVVVILFLILGFIIIQGGKVISWDFLTEAPEVFSRRLSEHFIWYWAAA